MTKDQTSGQKSQILVVDDSLEDIQLLIKILGSQGYIVHSAPDGEAVFSLVETTWPDLILLDIMMPKMDGYQVCARLKASEHTRDIPVIFMTALNETQNKIKGFQLGAVDFITKPFQIQEIVARVELHLALHTAQKQLEAQNMQLQQEIIHRKWMEEEIWNLNLELEERVRERTAQLETINQELRQSEARYRHLLHTITSYVYTVEIQQNQAVSTTHGPGCMAITGYTTAEYTADPYLWYCMIHKDDRNMVLQAVERLLTGETVQPLEHQIYHKDGSIRWIRHTLVPHLDHEGHLIAYDGLIEDITERRRAEEERKALIAELETKNAELERFTYTVSHDLKSPLITIQGFLGYLERNALVGDVKQVRQDIARISNATDKMEQLLQELLELSRIGRLINPPEVVPFGELAQEAVDMVAGRLAERNIKVEIASDPATVYGDRARLREALQNLVDNAVKFLDDPPNPQIEIGVRHYKDDDPGTNGECVFYVRDNGIGIDARYHQKIFGLFEKLDPKLKGTGIGLAIVKRIIEVHGGRIWVESEGAGKGSTFCFTLPDKRERSEGLSSA